MDIICQLETNYDVTIWDQIGEIYEKNIRKDEMKCVL